MLRFGGELVYFMSALSFSSLSRFERRCLLLSVLLVSVLVYIAPTEALTDEVM